jgi:hypothetical protein
LVRRSQRNEQNVRRSVVRGDFAFLRELRRAEQVAKLSWPRLPWQRRANLKARLYFYQHIVILPAAAQRQAQPLL